MGREISGRLLLLLSLVSAICVATGVTEARSAEAQRQNGANAGATADGVKAGGRGGWNGYVEGQAGSPLDTDYVMGVREGTETANGVDRNGWDGYIMGQAGSPLQTDVAVMPRDDAPSRKAWNGFIEGQAGSPL